MSWTKVLSVEALSDGKREVVKIGSKSILLLNYESQIYAIDNACPHLNLSMKKGKLTEDGAIICPWHRSAFDLRTGNVKEWTPWPPVVGNVLGKISSQKALAVFPVRVEENSIWVDVA
jgi:nitrite reductase/ring-hydroxylating ferredoxin subunit